MFVSILVSALRLRQVEIPAPRIPFPYLILRATYRFSPLSHISQLFCSNPNSVPWSILECYSKTLPQLPTYVIQKQRNKAARSLYTSQHNQVAFSRWHSWQQFGGGEAGRTLECFFSEICRNIEMIITIDKHAGIYSLPVFLHCLFI